MAREPRKLRRVAEGVYERDGKYVVPIYRAELVPVLDEDGDPVYDKTGSLKTKRKAGRKWHQLPDGTTLKQAKAYKAEREAEKLRGEDTSSTETVREFADKWEMRFPHRKPSTVRHNLERVKAFVNDYGDSPLDAITKRMAHDWALAHPSNWAAVRAMYSDAKDMELVPANPFSNLRIAKGNGRKNIKILTADEINKLAATARQVHGEFGEHFADLILAAAWTGLRPGELFALIPERIDFERGVIHVEESADNKTGRVWSLKTEESDRVVAILPEAEGPLRRALEVRGPEEFVFQPPHARTRFYRDGKSAMRGVNFGYYWHPVRDAFTAKLPESHWLPRRVRDSGMKGKLVLYEMRHTFGTRLAQAGVQPPAIANQMGHKDGGALAMDVYCHLSDEDVQQQIRALFAA